MKRSASSSSGARRSAKSARKRVARKLSRVVAIRAPPTHASHLHETGFVDVANAAYGLTSPSTQGVTLLNPIPVGASVNQRIGKKVALKSLQMRGVIVGLQPLHFFSENTVIIVYDRKPAGALPSVTDILANDNSNSMNNDVNAPRFKIIRRWDHVLLGNIVNSITSTTAVNLDAFVDLKGLPVIYKATGTGTIGDIETGALYLVTLGTGTAVPAAYATLQAAFRIRYSD